MKEVCAGRGEEVRKAPWRARFADSVAGVTGDPVPDEKRMRLRYSGTCRVCGVDLPATTDAIYEGTTKTVRCADCSPVATVVAPTLQPDRDEVIDVGSPGASARREFERRQRKREERIRSRHPKLGGLILALSDEPQSTKAWDVGAVGEERVGTRLNELETESLRVLHDRRIPGSRANIDHIAVARSGVYVIDPKRYKGRPSLKLEGGLLRPRVEKLLVGGRDCTGLVDGLLKQVDVIRGIVGDEVPVHGVLCFVDADWPLIGGSFTTRQVEALWPRKLYPMLQVEGSLTVDAIADLHRKLAAGLSAA
jgi:Nuclease-related domain